MNLRQRMKKSQRNRVIAFAVFMPFGIFAHGIASAAWTPIDPVSNTTAGRRYIDLDTVRQTGPMAIHRQVKELTVYPVRLESGPMSILRSSEYDCMNARVRVLSETGFLSPEGDGETAKIPDGYRRRGDWSALNTDPANQAVWDTICPGDPQR